MVLPTRVKFVNETDQRIKLRLGKKDDQIVNLAPGEVFSASGSVNFAYDIEADIIINPKGPDNNTYLGEFRFNNPAVGFPNVRSDDFYYFNERFFDGGEYSQIYNRGDSGLETKWGVLPNGLMPIRITKETDFEKLTLFEALGFAPAPVFDIKVSDKDVDAKDWELRITAVPDPLA